ncbi:hypothetical protein BCR32DRAFT_292867 [Anaeromyces robustus]|uniref:Uncharacterized protein n=1 Tax=Anaeromyces robustus TaxID=1754192 RepID=A0A1Y1X8L6_9FUNG|nr:hypothetical protein BCR32DRAFT_292867 [Anaeromyces robustus]|eukprot:ORX82105.1 hypothetical protein BCR32DRAFT_292867 [Anaeromyces robustus]
MGSNNLIMTESKNDYLDSNISFIDKEEYDAIKDHLKDIIAEIYPNKERLDIKEIFNVLKLFEEKNLIELKELDESLELFINQYDSEIQDVSLDDICSLIQSFIPQPEKDISLYDSDSELSFSSDNHMKSNTKEVDKSKEEFHIPAAIDKNQNSNIENNNENKNSIDSNKNVNNTNNNNTNNNNDNNNDNKITDNNNNISDKDKDKIVFDIDNDNFSIDLNDDNNLIPPSESSANENSELLFGSFGKDSTMPYTSSSDNLKIIKLDKYSTSDILNISNLLDAEAQSLHTDSIFNTDNIKDRKRTSRRSSRRNTISENNNYNNNVESVTDISSIKLDSDNTEKYFKELATMLRQNLIKSMANCQNLCNDLKLRDKTIKGLKTEIDELKKNFEESNKKLRSSEREINIMKQRETQFMENIKEYSEKELEQQKNASNLITKYNKLEKQYNNQQTELNLIHDRSQRHLSELKQKEEELKVALEEVNKARDGMKIEEGKQNEMKKRLKEYEKQLKTIPTEIKEEIENNDLKWEQKVKEQKDFYEEQFMQLQEEIEKKSREEDELIRRNKELLIQIEALSSQINDLKAERDLDLSLSQSMNGSVGAMKNLNVELSNALAMDQEKDKKIEENIIEIQNLKDKCQLLEEDLKNIQKDNDELIKRESQWKKEQSDNIMIIKEYLKPQIEEHKANEAILKNTIEELNNELNDLKDNIDAKVQELLLKEKEEMIKELGLNGQMNNINTFAYMVNDAVQTSGDMKDIIKQLEKSIEDFDDMNNQFMENKLKPPPEYHIDNNVFDEGKKEYDDHDISIDQSELIIADENNLDSEVPVISCNISIMEEDLAKLNEKNKLDRIPEELLNSNNQMDLIANSLPEMNFVENKNNDEDNDNNILNENLEKVEEEKNENDIIINSNEENNNNKEEESSNKNNENDNDNNDNNNDNDNDINDINDNNDNDNKIETQPIPNDKITSLINQEKNINKKDSFDPNIPILDRLDTKTSDDKLDNSVTKQEENIDELLNQPLTLTNENNENDDNNKDKLLLDTSIPNHSLVLSNSNNMNQIETLSPSSQKKRSTKALISFIFFQSFIIFITAISVVLIVEKMLGIRIIMKFVDIFLEDEHLIKDEGSPS